MDINLQKRKVISAKYHANMNCIDEKITNKS